VTNKYILWTKYKLLNIQMAIELELGNLCECFWKIMVQTQIPFPFL